MDKEKLKKLCEESSLFENIKKTDGKITFFKGSEDPDILFIGEAPGVEENKQGVPFIGKSGKLLDKWIEEFNFSNYAVINVVPIIPLEDGKIRKPTIDEIKYFREFVKETIEKLNPKKIICLGKSACESLEVDFNIGNWQGNVGAVFHPAYYLRQEQNGISDLKKLFPEGEFSDKKFISEIENSKKTTEEVVNDFLNKIGAKIINKDEFTYNDEKWLIDYHPYDHSDDIIIPEKTVSEYDNFLLVKTGAKRTRIPGWCSRENLLSTSKRDIYRNNKFYHMVVDVNLKDLSYFKIKKEKVLKTNFSVNKQVADNQGYKEMINGILAGLHMYANKCNVFFKDINQKDECVIGDKKVKIYTRDIYSDEDMLVYDKYYKENPDVDLYLCCKVKATEYFYVGFIDKEVVEGTRVVKMIGSDSDKESSDIRRIFAEQYRNLNEIFPIYEEKTEDEKIVEQNFVPLHCHGEFSVGDGFGTIKEMAEKFYKKGFKSASLTDHGTLGGAWEFQKAMLAKGLKPLLGSEFYVKIPEKEGRRHIVLLAKNETGWKNILKLHSLAVREHFYYRPTVPVEDLLENSEGVICISGCSQSIFNFLIGIGKEDVAEKYVKKFKNSFGDDFYGEMQIHNIGDNQKVLKKAYKLFSENDVKCVITLDSHYPDKKDKKHHDALKAISMRKEYGEAGYGDDCFYVMTDKDLEKEINDRQESVWLLEKLPELKKNTFEISDKINFEIKPTEKMDTLPKYFPTEAERKERLKQICLEGLEKNTPYEYKGKIKERLDLEMNRILSKNYENYFLIVWDLIKWCKNNGILIGPGRGSVGSSLAAYALGITGCDPIKFDLLFDRFLSEIRKDMPDIDMDFQDDRRYEVFEYLTKKYGEKHTAKVATYSRFHPKGILRDVGRIFKIPISEVEKICKLVLQRSGGDARASFGLLDTFEEFEEAKEFKKKYPLASEIAIRFEGHVRHKGQHAAAMVVTDKDISEYTPIAKVGGIIVTEWEKGLVEEAKLVKLDILGLKTLTVISDCVKDAKIELPNTFEDPKVYDKVFKNGDTLGVFQFETTGLSKMCQNVKPDSFNLLYDISTLFRPGALHSGQSMLYVHRHIGKEEIKVEHPLLKEITKTTKGIVLYQEQIMQIMNQIGGMSWATSEMARKVITKSKGKKAFEEFRKEFVRNANKLHNMEKKEAEKLYDVVSTFGSYCISGDSIVYRCSSNQHTKKEIKIKDLYEYQNSDNFKHRKIKILSMDADGKIRPNTVKEIIKTGKQKVFFIGTDSGKNIKATENHKFLINNKWKKLKEAKEGDFILVTDFNIPIKNKNLGLGKDNHLECPRFKKGHYTIQERIDKIIFSGERETYDIEMEDAPRNYVANNFIVHNSFNKTHAVEYSIISFWCAWLKTYYPEIFYKNILKHESDDVQISNYTDDAHKNGIEIEYPHINFSKYRFTTAKGKIYSGFSSIKGIGEKVSEKIEKYQPYLSFEDFRKKTKINNKILENLIIADCFREFNINKKQTILNLNQKEEDKWSKQMTLPI